MLEDMKQPVKILPCKIRTIAESLNEKDKEILLKAAIDPNWQPYVLMKELKKREIEVSDRTIRTHRNKECSCWKI